MTRTRTKESETIRKIIQDSVLEEGYEYGFESGNFYTEEDIEVMFEEYLKTQKKEGEVMEDNGIKGIIAKALKEEDDQVELVKEGIDESLLSLVQLTVYFTETQHQSGVYILPTEAVEHILTNINDVKGNVDVDEMVDVEFGLRGDYRLKVESEFNVPLDKVRRVGFGLYRIGEDVYDELYMLDLGNHFILRELFMSGGGRKKEEFSDYTNKYLDDVFYHEDILGYVLGDFLEYLNNQPVDRSDEVGFEDIKLEFRNETKEEVLKELYNLRKDLESIL